MCYLKALLFLGRTRIPLPEFNGTYTTDPILRNMSHLDLQYGQMPRVDRSLLWESQSCLILLAPLSQLLLLRAVTRALVGGIPTDTHNTSVWAGNSACNLKLFRTITNLDACRDVRLREVAVVLLKRLVHLAAMTSIFATQRTASHNCTRGIHPEVTSMKLL